MNNKYKIVVRDPLLRPGLSIETVCSEKYLEAVTKVIMEKIRNINNAGK